MNAQYDYTVIEDNGGGLQLFLFEPGTQGVPKTPVMGFTGFEYSPGSLIASLDALDNGDDARRWDGKIDDAGAQWDYIQQNESGYEVICYCENGAQGAPRTIKPERMGKAGQIEFGYVA